MQERKQLFRLNEGMVALFPKDAVKGFPINFATLWATASDAQWAGSDLNTQLSAAINDAAFLIDRGALMYVVSNTMSAEKVTDAVVQWAVPATDHIEVNVLTVVANNATLVTKRIANSESVAAEGVLTGYVKEAAYTALVPEDTFNNGINFYPNTFKKLKTKELVDEELNKLKRFDVDYFIKDIKSSCIKYSLEEIKAIEEAIIEYKEN